MAQPDDYTIGWICALKVEYVAAQEFLDEEHGGPEAVAQHDNNSYTLGRIGKHNIVIATLPFGEYGTTSAATVARDMIHSFPNIRVGLMVGIGGGVPSENHDIRLGDIVVSAPSNGNSGLFQYDFGKNIQDQPYQTTGNLNRPPAALLTALAGLQTRYERHGHKLEEAVDDVLEKNERLQREYKKPSSISDRLYRSEIVHPHTEKSCAAVCDPSGLIIRAERAEDEDNPAIHYGLIASANQLMKNALLRDKFAAEKDVLCFEMEAAGLMNHFPCLVIRGICDYSDSHKNKEWQGYAAMVAAAYAKDLLYQIPFNTQKVLEKEKLLRKEQKERQECHQLFRLTAGNKDTTYEWYKGRVEDRVEDTCMWFLNHDHFKRWLQQDAGPLLVTADPGCGKSVLAKYLIDHVLPQATTTVCYFFFKDQDQNTMRQALCALLHQLFTKTPSLIEHAIPQYRTNGRGLINSTESLWKILQNATTDPSNKGSIIIVLDALDECAESECEDLVKNVKRQFRYNQKSYGKLKYLLTCRPYEQIVSSFRSQLSTFPYIRIPGEEESDAISREVDLVISHQVDLLARAKLLSPPTKNELEKRLKQTTNRTYLWICLIFNYLKKEDFKKTQKAVISIITTLPKTANEAYNQILTKSKDILLAHKALSIILAASRPLKVSEMNVAVNIDFQSTRDLDLEDNSAFETRLRSCCGLFISIYHGKVYFLHQTAREFLVDAALPTATLPKVVALPPATLPELQWHRSITVRNAHAILAEICVLYLNLLNLDASLSTNATSADGHTSYGVEFVDYSARFWNAHFHEAKFEDGSIIIPFTLRICDPISMSYCQWFEIYFRFLNHKLKDTQPLSFTHLMVAAYCGHDVLVKLLLQQGADIEAKDDRHRTSLLWASYNGHEAVVKVLLEKGAEFRVKDAEAHRAPLFWASSRGHGDVVKMLLEKGADVDTKDVNGETPLLWAVLGTNEAMIKLLLKNCADVNARNKDNETPLLRAVYQRNEAFVKLLLENGAEVNVKNKYYETPLSGAVLGNNEAVTRLLLANGADVNAKNEHNETPLSRAVRGKNKAVVKLLLQKGADINAKDRDNKTLLFNSVVEKKEDTIKLLLSHGADVDEKNEHNETPLSRAVLGKNKAIIKLLLENGADVNAKDNHDNTPLSFAASTQYDDIVDLLVKAGADVNARNNMNQTPLFFAAAGGHEAVVKILLKAGADTEVIDSKRFWTPLRWASTNRSEAVVKLLLENGARVKGEQVLLARKSERGKIDLLLEEYWERQIKESLERERKESRERERKESQERLSKVYWESRARNIGNGRARNIGNGRARNIGNGRARNIGEVRAWNKYRISGRKQDFFVDV